MNDLILTLTDAEFGTDAATFRLLTMGSLLLVAVAQVFLARRNDLGWWVYLLGMFVGPVAIALFPGQVDYWQLLGVAPQVIVGAAGLAGFSRYSLRGKFTRRVENARFSVVAAIGLAAFAFVTALLQFGAAIQQPSVIFSSAALTPWLSFIGTALVAAGLLGVGFGARWAWLVTALGGLWLAGFTTAQPAMTGATQPLFGLLLGYVLIFLSALYGFFAWGTPVPAAEPEAADEDTDDDAADAAAAPENDDAVPAQASAAAAALAAAEDAELPVAAAVPAEALDGAHQDVEAADAEASPAEAEPAADADAAASGTKNDA